MQTCKVLLGPVTGSEYVINHIRVLLFKVKSHVDNLLKDFFHELLTRTMSESLILCDQGF